MERLKLKFNDAVRALKTLEEIMQEEYSVIVRDAAIQRFEYTFEAVWKFFKEYLKENEGIIINSPKGCFRNVFSLGFLTEEETAKCLEMVDSRNDTAHTYKEKVAAVIYSKIKEYTQLMKNLLDKFDNS